MRRIAVGLAAALTITLVPANAGSAAAGDPSYHQPTEGDCHDYTYAALYELSDTSPVVPCTDPHAAKVVKVFLLPDGVSWSEHAAVGRAVTKRCTPAYEEWLGRSELTRALTSYAMAWFAPTKAERNQGARWARCDVVLFGGNTSLAPVPYDAAPLIPNPITDSVRKCLTGKYSWTTCDRTHAWRSAGDFNVRKGKYPSAKQMRAIAIRKCSKLVSTSRGYFTSPSKDDWRAGDRVVVCFSKTTS